MKQTLSLSNAELQLHLEELNKWGVLELCPEPQDRIVRIPYIMNDAVEKYITFYGSTLQGTLEEEGLYELEFHFTEHATKQGIIIRQPSGNVVTLWYETAELTTACYQYHMIGHAWRKQPGEEYIRRLVNLICVLHDKMEYLGKNHCSSNEIRLALLAEFSPVIWYTPIDRSIIEWYGDTELGIGNAASLLAECGLTDLVEEMKNYKTLYDRGRLKSKHIEKFAKALMSPGGRFFWYTIDRMICEASEQLDERIYDGELNEQITSLRAQVSTAYEKNGYTGTYPRLKDAAGNEVIFVEEHPFTVMEEEEYKFKIFSMKVKHADIRNVVWQREC